MKLIISTLLFIALPYSIFCNRPKVFPEEVARLDALAGSSTPTVGGSITLKPNGFLGDGGFGFVYEGLNVHNHCPVAVKFATEANKKHMQREFEMFIYLNAYNNPNVERFGIPMLHHYGTWEEFTFIVISKLGKNLFKISRKGGLDDPLNVLISCRNFIIQSKYIHSKGVRHDDIKPGNIMVREHRTFLLDFNMSAKMAEYNHFCTIWYASRRYHQGQLRHPIDDIESFLYSMLYMVGVPLKWFDAEHKNKTLEQKFQLFGELKNETHDVWDLINNHNHIEDDDLREIFNHFAFEVYGDEDSKTVPNYNNLERLITEKIMMYRDEDSPFLPTFTWLTTDIEKQAAKEDPLPDIESEINEPQFIDYESFPYPDVPQFPPAAAIHDDEDHQHQMCSSSRGSNVEGPSKKKSSKILRLFSRKK